MPGGSRRNDGDAASGSRAQGKQLAAGTDDALLDVLCAQSLVGTPTGAAAGLRQDALGPGDVGGAQAHAGHMHTLALSRAQTRQREHFAGASKPSWDGLREAPGQEGLTRT